MAREIKDELQQEDNLVPTETQSQPLSPFEITADEQIQDTLVQIVKADFEKMTEDRSASDYGLTAKGEKIDFDKRIKLIQDLYYARRLPKDTPWKYCSNRSLRIAASILDMLHARLLPAVYDGEKLAWRAVGEEDELKRERITKLMQVWLKTRADFASFADEWVLYATGIGECFTETAYEEELRDRSDGLPPFKTEKTVSRIIPRENIYFFEGTEDIQKEPVIVKTTYLFHELEAMEAEGKLVNVIEKLKPLIAVLTPANAKTEEEVERIKDIRRRNEPIEVLKWYGKYDADGDGLAEDVRVLVAEDYDIYLGGVRNRDFSYRNIRPVHFQLFSPRLDKPGKLEGEGILEKVRELSDEIDAIFNQLTDANTLSVMRPGFFDPHGDLNAAALTLAPRKLIPVPDPQRNVYFPDITIPIERLIMAVRLVLEFIERLTAASSYAMGRESEIVGGSGTATRTNAIMQSAQVRFQIPVTRLRSGFAKIITQHLDLLQKNMPPGLESRLLGEKGERLFGDNELTKEGIGAQLDAYLPSDLGLGSAEVERELMGMLYSILMQNMIVGTDPQKIYRITADLLKAYNKNPETYLGPAPNPDDIDSPEQENTLMLQGDFIRVKANLVENHLQHIQVHTQLNESPTLAEVQQRAPHLTEQVLAYNKMHIEEHMQMMQAMQKLVSTLGGKAGGGVASGGEAGSSQESAPVEGAGGMALPASPMEQALGDKRAGEVYGPQ